MRGFADYFLIVHALTEFARERGIPAVGRGSAANSIVAYVLGITSVEPLRYDLPFERFLSPARRDCPDIDLDTVPEDDPQAAALLSGGHTLGCFQVESPGMRNLVVRMNTRDQEDAMIALSLIRPDPAGSGMKDAYIRRRRGEEGLPALESAFRDGAREQDIAAEVVEQVWESIKRFSAYAYNKAHAAAYSRISWQGLYLKARYPASYLAAVLRNRGGFYAARAYVEEARRMGCRIELPCVNRSDIGALGRVGVLRLGLDQIKGLRRATPAALVRIREATGPYLSPTDLLLRTTIEKHEAERLVLAGALDIFDRPRGELLWMLTLDFSRYARAREECREKRSLFGPTAMPPPPKQIPVPPSYRTEELLAMEVEALGLTATCHPSELWDESAKEAGALATTELAEHVGEAVRIGGWIVPDRRVRVRPARKGQRPKRSAGRHMKFLTIEDLHGTVEVTLFPDAYARVGHRLTAAGPFLVAGTVRDDHGALTLDANDILTLAIKETP